MKTCPKCNAQIGDTAKFCIKCGCNIKMYEEEQSVHIYFCPECGTQFSGGTFCPECGFNVAEDINTSDAETSQLGSFELLGELAQAAAQQKEEEDNKAANLKKMSAFEYVEHTDGTFSIVKLKDVNALNIVVPENVTNILTEAFSGSGLISIILPESLMQIGDRAFNNCKNLMQINFPQGLVIIGEEAFDGCEMLEVESPTTVKKIGENAFRNTASDIRRQKEEALSRAKEEQLARQRAEREAYIHRNFWFSGTELLKYIGTDVGDLWFVDIPDSVTSICDEAFRGKSLRSITISNSVTTIGNSAFSGCTSLVSVTIPDRVTSIGNYAFSGCTSLVSVTIPDSVKSIDAWLFNKCSNLKSISLPNHISTTSFFGTPSTCKIVIRQN